MLPIALSSSSSKTLPTGLCGVCERAAGGQLESGQRAYERTLSQIILVLGVMAARSSSRSTFHSAAETFDVAAASGARMGTKTGTPPLERASQLYHVEAPRK